MASDNFAATNNPLASPWTSFGGSFGGMKSASGVCSNAAGSDGDAGAYYSSSSATESQIDYVSGTTDGGPAVHMGTGPDGYVDTAYDGVSIYTFRLDDGGYSGELGHAVFPYVATQPVKIRRSGNNLISSINAVDRLTVTDTTYTGGSPGIFGYAGNFTVDNWTDGAAGDQTITCTGIATATATGSQTISKVTAQAVTATGIASASALGSQTISNVSAQSISTTGIATASATGNQTISTISVQNISTTGIATNSATGNQTIAKASPQSLACTGIASATALGSHTVSHEVTSAGIASASETGSQAVSNVAAQTISCTGIGSASALGSQTISDIVLAVTCTGIGSASSLGNQTIEDSSTDQTITCTGIGTASALGSQTISDIVLAVSPTGISSAAAFGRHQVFNESTPPPTANPFAAPMLNWWTK